MFPFMPNNQNVGYAGAAAALPDQSLGRKPIRTDGYPSIDTIQ
jgi:hypothetical protein